MRAVAADADEAFATMFWGSRREASNLKSQIAAAIAAEKALGAGAVEAASKFRSSTERPVPTLPPSPVLGRPWTALPPR